MSSNPSPALAAVLSFFFPGLGQVYAGDVRKGLVWAIPMLIFIVAVLFLVMGGPGAFTSLLTIQKLIALIVLDIAFFLYHVAATVDAYDIARRDRSLTYARRSSSAAPIVLAALVALAMVLHGLPAAYAANTVAFLQSETRENPNNVIPTIRPIASRAPTPTPDPNATVAPTLPPESEEPEPTETPLGSIDPNYTPPPKNCPPAPDFSGWEMADDGRVNIFMVGSDSRSDDGVSPKSLRTDSMMLLSVEIATCKAALFSFPRNMAQPSAESRYPSWFNIPLADGSSYEGFLFALWRDAAANPGWPGSEDLAGVGPECQEQFDCDRGWRALSGAIQDMTAADIDAIVAVNLKGFVDIVQNLPGGGVWIDIPEPLYDEEYFNSQQQRMLVDFDAGCQFLDAEETLAYARSRHQDSDYERGRRQQIVLTAIRKQLDPLALLPSIPGLLNAAGPNLFMSISDKDIPNLAQVASRVDADRMYRYDFAPAKLSRLGSMQGLRDKVQNIFSEPEPTPPAPRPGGGGGGGAQSCPPRQ